MSAEKKKRGGCKPCWTTDRFILEARKVHGKRYDYSKSVYTKSVEPLRIICVEHGEFWQKPNVHLRPNGCPKCADKRGALANSHTKEDFIKIARDVHGNKYDYTLVNYKNQNIPVTIVCPVHGKFRQSPKKHKQGRECKGCAKSGFDTNRSGLLYYFEKKDENGKSWYKLGITNRPLNRRYSNRFLESVSVLLEKNYSDGAVCQKVEKHIKKKYNHLRIAPPDGILDKYSGLTEVYPTNILNL